ncbi:hypothetical protein ACNUDN_03275 [Mycobacterium sp. smrl_JER01]|uniref:hypothetical protein n=1 Tax=Mycobacterium sp. smrl_JER01 TaxID=3402633 RepID=UPI003AD7B625
MLEHTPRTVIEEPAGAGELPAPPARPVAVPAVAADVGRWRFVLVVTAMWLVCGAAGAGLYFWWFHSVDKTLPVFAVLVLVVACVVGSLLTAMVQDRPGVAATAIALMSAPFAAAVGAGLLYASYGLGWIAG